MMPQVMIVKLKVEEPRIVFDPPFRECRDIILRCFSEIIDSAEGLQRVGSLRFLYLTKVTKWILSQSLQHSVERISFSKNHAISVATKLYPTSRMHGTSYLRASILTSLFLTLTHIFPQTYNSVHVSVLLSIKYALTSCPFSRWDKLRKIDFDSRKN